MIGRNYSVRPRGSHGPERSRTGGFTLLEILTATAMFAVLIGALYAVFFGSLRLREKANEAMEAQLPRNRVAEIIRRDLAGIVAQGSVLAGAMYGEKKESGSAHLDTLEVHTASGSVVSNTPWGDIQRVQYSLEEPEDSKMGVDSGELVLVRAVTRNLLASTEEEVEKENLLDGVQSVQFSYYDGEQWQESWDSTTAENQLPYAVRVRIDFSPPQPGARRLLPLEITVPVTVRPVTSEQEQAEGTGTNPGTPTTPGGV